MKVNGLKCGIALGGLLPMVLTCAGQVSSYPGNNGRPTNGEDLPKRHHLYVGTHVAAQVFQVTSTTYPVQEAVIRPLYLFAGYQLSPRLAVQMGFLQRNPPAIISNTSGIDRTGKPFKTYSYYDEYNGAVPVLLRYGFARRPIHRLHLDALLGLTLVIHDFKDNYVNEVANQVVYEAHEYSHARNVNVTVGLGLGFDIVSHVELMVEGTSKLNLKTLQVGYIQRITPGVGAGLRYRFNIGKGTN